MVGATPPAVAAAITTILLHRGHQATRGTMEDNAHPPTLLQRGHQATRGTMEDNAHLNA
jgi:hypothetical protein